MFNDITTFFFRLRVQDRERAVVHGKRDGEVAISVWENRAIVEDRQ